MGPILSEIAPEIIEDPSDDRDNGMNMPAARPEEKPFSLNIATWWNIRPVDTKGEVQRGIAKLQNMTDVKTFRLSCS